jgi:hypothetical protein
MRKWNRSADQLGDKALEVSIQQELERRFPSEKFPVNIDVVGTVVQITNFETGIEVFAKAVPGVGRGTYQAVIETAERAISEVIESGKLRRLRDD